MKIKDDYYSLVRSHLSGPVDFGLLDRRNAFLDERLKRCLGFAGKTLPSELLIGWLPVEKANAFACQSRHGHMILINDGLDSFALALASLFAAVVPGDSGGRMVPPILAASEAIQVFSIASEQFVEGVLRQDYPPSLSSVLNKLRQLTGPREALAQWHYCALLDFVIAHELAHVLHGDLGEANAFGPHFYVREFDLQRCQVELKADNVAGRLLQSMYAGSFRSRRDLENTPEDRGLTGAVLFFDGLEATWWLQGSDHPSPAERRAALICDAFREHGPLTPVPYLDHAVRTIAVLRGVDPETLEARIRDTPRQEYEAVVSQLRRYAQLATRDQALQAIERWGSGWGYKTATVRRIMGQSHEIARALVAGRALSYIRSGPATNYVYRIDLGVFASVYSEIYANDPGFAPFLRLLQKGIGNIDEIIRSVSAFRNGDGTVQYYTRERDAAEG